MKNAAGPTTQPSSTTIGRRGQTWHTEAMNVRPAVHSDLPAILDIYNDAVINTTATYDEQPDTLADRQAWFEEHLRSGYPIFVAETSGTVVAWSSLSQFRERSGYRFTAENSVYVAPAEQGKGIGKLLIPPLIESAQQLGLHAIMACIDANSEVSIRLHAAFGFERVAYLRQVGYKFNRWLDVIYMEKLL